MYILFSSAADKFYIGYSEYPWSRLQQHKENGTDKFTGKYDDWELAAVFEVGSSQAQL